MSEYLKDTITGEQALDFINGIPVKWVFSLSETHTVLYGTIPQSEETINLFWMEDESRVPIIMQLTQKEKHRWIHQLERF